MRESQFLDFLYTTVCYKTTHDDIMRFLIDEGHLTRNGSDFENELVEDALNSLNWDYICRIQSERAADNLVEENESEEEEEEEEEEDEEED